MVGGARARIKGSLVEDNTFSVSAHYRMVADREVASARSAWSTTQRSRRCRCARTAGKMVYELRPSADWDKGKAVEYLAASRSARSRARRLPRLHRRRRTDGTPSPSFHLAGAGRNRHHRLRAPPLPATSAGSGLIPPTADAPLARLGVDRSHRFARNAGRRASASNISRVDHRPVEADGSMRPPRRARASGSDERPPPRSGSELARRRCSESRHHRPRPSAALGADVAATLATVRPTSASGQRRGDADASIRMLAGDLPRRERERESSSRDGERRERERDRRRRGDAAADRGRRACLAVFGDPEPARTSCLSGGSSAPPRVRKACGRVGSTAEAAVRRGRGRPPRRRETHARAIVTESARVVRARSIASKSFRRRRPHADTRRGADVARTRWSALAPSASTIASRRHGSASRLGGAERRPTRHRPCPPLRRSPSHQVKEPSARGPGPIRLGRPPGSTAVRDIMCDAAIATRAPAGPQARGSRDLTSLLGADAAGLRPRSASRRGALAPRRCAGRASPIGMRRVGVIDVAEVASRSAGEVLALSTPSAGFRSTPSCGSVAGTRSTRRRRRLEATSPRHRSGPLAATRSALARRRGSKDRRRRAAAALAPAGPPRPRRPFARAAASARTAAPRPDGAVEGSRVTARLDRGSRATDRRRRRRAARQPIQCFGVDSAGERVSSGIAIARRRRSTAGGHSTSSSSCTDASAREPSRGQARGSARPLAPPLKAPRAARRRFRRRARAPRPR